jgi:Holliday junction resolvase
MAVNRYASGARFERKVKEHLAQEFGFFVIRSPQSRSPLDLIAIRKGQVFFVQCKTNARFDPGEWNEFYSLCLEVGAEPLLAANERGKIVYFQLLGPKDGNERAQPYRRVTLKLS